MKFADLRLVEPLLRAVAADGYETPSPIQAKAIPPALEGRDVLGCAQTGTGKTAAFALPILQRLSAKKEGAPRQSKVRCVVLCPTRELATQIAQSFSAYGRHLGLTNAVIFGGVGQGPQVAALRRGVDVVIATPGRLLDLIEQGHADFRSVEALVLDEADRMLDMGFIHDIRRVVATLPAARQTMLFSATMPREIRTLANTLLRNPVSVQVAPEAATADRVGQSVYFVERKNKPTLLAHLVNELPMTRTIVFTRTKHGADRVVRQLHTRGIKAEAIHGNKSQNARQRALHNFKVNKTPILVATDIASRGIDVDAITHVVNYDISDEPETYVHRIGRTARAGASGEAVSFCDKEEVPNLRAIERLIRQAIPVKNDHPAYPKGQDHDADSSDRDRPRRQDQPQHRRQPASRPHAGGPARPAHPAHSSDHPRRQESRGQSHAGGRPAGHGAVPRKPSFGGGDKGARRTGRGVGHPLASTRRRHA